MSMIRPPTLGRRAVLLGTVGFAASAAIPAARAGAVPALSRIALANAHTGERFSGIYRDAEAPLRLVMGRIATLLRDHRTGGTRAIDPALIDTLAALARRIGGGDEAAQDVTFTVLSGYRSRETNAMLARSDPWVALDSLHMVGRAVDVRVEGVDLAALRDAALGLRRGGVGYYPTRGFLHLDTGAVRTWTRPAGAEAPAVAAAGEPSPQGALRDLWQPPDANPSGSLFDGGAPGGPSLGGMSLRGADRGWPSRW